MINCIITLRWISPQWELNYIFQPIISQIDERREKTSGLSVFLAFGIDFETGNCNKCDLSVDIIELFDHAWMNLVYYRGNIQLEVLSAMSHTGYFSILNYLVFWVFFNLCFLFPHVEQWMVSVRGMMSHTNVSVKLGGFAGTLLQVVFGKNNQCH